MKPRKRRKDEPLRVVNKRRLPLPDYFPSASGATLEDFRRAQEWVAGEHKDTGGET